MSIKFSKVAYNRRDEWPTIAEIGGLDSPKYTMNHKKRIMLEIINDNRSNDYEFQYYEKIDTDLLKVNQVACEIIRRIRQSKKNN